MVYNIFLIYSCIWFAKFDLKNLHLCFWQMLVKKILSLFGLVLGYSDLESFPSFLFSDRDGRKCIQLLQRPGRIQQVSHLAYCILCWKVIRSQFNVFYKYRLIQMIDFICDFWQSMVCCFCSIPYILTSLVENIVERDLSWYSCDHVNLTSNLCKVSSYIFYWFVVLVHGCLIA